jgi:hypothetical protein
MHFSNLLLALIPLAVAVDIRFMDGGCDGPAIGCTTDPNQCCSIGFQRSYYRIAAAPDHWSMQTKVFKEENCKNWVDYINKRGNFHCSNSPSPIKSGAWAFYNGPLKRKARADAGEGAAKEKCKRADTLWLEDESQYDVGGLTDDEQQHLVRGSDPILFHLMHIKPLFPLPSSYSFMF